MIPEKARKVMFFFLTVYVLFAVIIVYLFLFNTGLEIVEEFNEDEFRKDVYIVNVTDRVIHNVSVKQKIDGNDFDLNYYRFLAPKEKRLVPTANLSSSQVTLVVEAPFHQTIEKLVVLKVKGESTVKLSFPSDVLFGKSFGFNIELCNRTKKEDEFKVEEEHQQSIFSEPPQTNRVTLAAGECKTISYSLIPIQKGETTIYFNVSSSSNSERLPQIIRID